MNGVVTKSKTTLDEADMSGRTAPRQTSGDRDRTGLLDYYRRMMLIRRFEERAERAYTEALVGGYCHLNLGEEAAIVGLLGELGATDYLFTNYREHGYAMTRGVEPRKVMAELYGRIDGVSKGWGGSMHMCDVTHRLLGGYGIVGGQLPIATGAALALQYQQRPEIVMCTLGDGTTATGAFHESLNLAGLWDLPIVYVIINNGLGMSTDVEHSSAEPELFRRGAAYRIESERVDGLDPATTADGASRAISVARSGRPYLLEVMTERLRGHSVVDPAKYRTREQIAELDAHDPVLTFAERLKSSSIMDDETSSAVDTEVKAIVDDAAAFAAASPQPEVSTLFDCTCATPLPNDSRRYPGDALFPGLPAPVIESGSIA